METSSGISIEWFFAHSGRNWNLEGAADPRSKDKNQKYIWPTFTAESEIRIHHKLAGSECKNLYCCARTNGKWIIKLKRLDEPEEGKDN